MTAGNSTGEGGNCSRGTLLPDNAGSIISSKTSTLPVSSGASERDSICFGSIISHSQFSLRVLYNSNSLTTFL
jgi:hypothetical protein